MQVMRVYGFRGVSLAVYLGLVIVETYGLWGFMKYELRGVRLSI